MATKNKSPKAPKTETAVIYCRVSSWKQTDGISLPNQETQCREACEKKGLKVLAVFADAYSGRTVTRDWLKELFKFIKKNDVGYCYIFQIDRISRWEPEVYYSIKDTLSQSNVELRDQEWIIRDKEIRLKEVWGYNMDGYGWNSSNGSRTTEALKATASADEADAILFRTIPKEIEYTQMGLHQREALYGFQNVKVFIPEYWQKGNIQMPHPIEAPFIVRMFELRSEGVKSDEEIAEELNRLWFMTRATMKKVVHTDGAIDRLWVKGRQMTAKKLQVMMKYTKYAGIVCEKWTNGLAIKAKYDGLVSIEIFNRANRWDIRIVENKDTGGYSIFNKNEVLPDVPAPKRPRTIHRPDFVYRKSVYSPYGEIFVKGSFAEGRSGQKYPNYHCVVPFDKARPGIELPKPTKTGYSFNCPRDIFEETIFNYFDAIVPEPAVIDFFEEYVGKEWEKYNEREETSEELLKRKKTLLEKRTEELLREIERLSIKDETLAINIILDKKNKEFEETQRELYSIEAEKPAEQITDREKFKTYARALMGNINTIIRNVESEELAKVLFSFIFERPPHYDELLNFTAPIFPVFRLNEKAIENSGRTGEKTASVMGKNYAGKPKPGSKSKAVSPGEKTESRTKKKVVSTDNKAKIKDPLGSGSSVWDLWQPH